MTFDLGVRSRGVPHAHDLHVEGVLAWNVPVECRQVANARYPLFAVNAIAGLGKIDGDTFGIAQAILGVRVALGPRLDADRGVEVFEVPLDLEDTVDLKAIVVHAALVVLLTDIRSALQEAHTEAAVGD